MLIKHRMSSVDIGALRVNENKPLSIAKSVSEA